jgi:hypothetical protein
LFANCNSSSFSLINVFLREILAFFFNHDISCKLNSFLCVRYATDDCFKKGH